MLPPATWPDRLIVWGVCALFFALPLTTTGVSLAGGLVVAVWLLSGKFLRERRKWLNQPWTKPVILFMLLPWIGLLWAPDLREGLDWASKSYVWFITFAVASLTCNRSHFPLFIKWFLAGLALVSVISLLQYFSIVPFREQVPSLLGWDRITGSLLLVFGMLIVSFEYGRRVSLRDKAVSLLALAFFFVTLLVTGGRAGYLAFVLLLPLFIYNLLPRGYLLLKVLLGLAFFGLMFLSPVAVDRTIKIGEDIISYRQLNPNTDAGLRLHMWSGAVQIFARHPLLGAGTGGYKEEMKKYIIPTLDPQFHHINDPHNSFLFMATSYGLLGLFSLGWLFYVFLKKGWRSGQEPEGFAILAYGLVLIIGSLTSTEIMSFHSGNLFAILMGLPLAPDRQA